MCEGNVLLQEADIYTQSTERWRGRWDAGGLFLSAAKKAEYPGVGENNEREMRRRATDLSSVFFRYWFGRGSGLHCSTLCLLREPGCDSQQSPNDLIHSSNPQHDVLWTSVAQGCAHSPTLDKGPRSIGSDNSTCPSLSTCEQTDTCDYTPYLRPQCVSTTLKNAH